MSGTSQSQSGMAPPRKRLFRWLIAGVLLGAATLYTLVSLLLMSPFVANQATRLLSSSLGQQAGVDSLSLSGGALRLKMVSIANPPGFPAGNLAQIQTIDIIPQWQSLASSTRRFASIRIKGARIDLRRSDGKWNFDPIRQHLAARPAAGETRIGRLEIEGGSLLIEGRGIEGISVGLDNFSTRGGQLSPLTADFADAHGTRCRLAGQARGGKDPELTLSLDAPAIRSATLVALLGGKTAMDAANGQGSLRLNAGYRGGLAKLDGRLELSGLRIRTGRRELPFRGDLSIAATYNQPDDELLLEKGALLINDLLSLQASGKMQGVRREGRFAFDCNSGELDLARLAGSLPGFAGKSLKGSLVMPVLRISGDRAKGLTGLDGRLALRNLTLLHGERLLADGVNGETTVGTGGGGLLARGRIWRPAAVGAAPLEGLEAPFTLALTRKFRPTQLELQEWRAQIMGMPLAGSLRFNPGATQPLAGTVSLKTSSPAELNRHLRQWGTELADGAVSLNLDLAGKGPRDFSGQLKASLDRVEGRRGDATFRIGTGRIVSAFRSAAGRLAADGDLDLSGVRFNGKEAKAKFAFNLADGACTLTGGSGAFDGSTFAFARMDGRFPPGGGAAAGGAVPLSLLLKGGEYSRGEIRLSGLEAGLQGEWRKRAGVGGLEGTGRIAAGSVLFRGQEIGSPAVRLRLQEQAGEASLEGRLLNGALSGLVRFNPYVRGGDIGIDLALAGADAAVIGKLTASGGAGPGLGGVVNGGVKGVYHAGRGFAGQVSLDGKALSARGKGGRELFSDAVIDLKGEIREKDLTLQASSFGIGQQPLLRVSGAVKDFAAKERQGALLLSLPSMAANSLFDAFANLIPRPIQDVSAEGTVAADATLGLRGREISLDGRFVAAISSLDIASQKLKIAGINGVLPISLQLPGEASRQPERRVSHSRTNYPALLAAARKRAAAGETMKIGPIHFGPLELGETTLTTHAEKGLIELTSLRSGLYEGVLLGSGFFRYQNEIHYGIDLLLDDLSLRELCNSFPAIKGYVSGRMDGVISLYGEGATMKEATGFTDLWTRSSKKEKMLVSKEFLQKLAGKKLRGFFFRDDRAYDRGEISAFLEDGYLTFEQLDVSHTNLLGMKDLSVAVAPVQNRIELVHLFNAVKQAAARGKAVKTGDQDAQPPLETEFKWQE